MGVGGGESEKVEMEARVLNVYKMDAHSNDFPHTHTHTHTHYWRILVVMVVRHDSFALRRHLTLINLPVFFRFISCEKIIPRLPFQIILRRLRTRKRFDPR